MTMKAGKPAPFTLETLQAYRTQWAAQWLELPRNSVPETQTPAVLRWLAENDFVPYGPGREAITLLTNPAAAQEPAEMRRVVSNGFESATQNRLREEIDDFARRFFQLTPDERRTTWNKLSTEAKVCGPLSAPLDLRLQALSPGLDVCPPTNREGWPEQVSKLLDLTLRLFVMRPAPRAKLRREELARFSAFSLPELCQAAKELHTRYLPGAAVLAPDLLGELIAPFKKARAVTPSDTTPYRWNVPVGSTHSSTIVTETSDQKPVDKSKENKALVITFGCLVVYVMFLIVFNWDSSRNKRTSTRPPPLSPNYNFKYDRYAPPNIPPYQPPTPVPNDPMYPLGNREGDSLQQGLVFRQIVTRIMVQERLQNIETMLRLEAPDSPYSAILLEEKKYYEKLLVQLSQPPGNSPSYPNIKELQSRTFPPLRPASSGEMP